MTKKNLFFGIILFLGIIFLFGIKTYAQTSDSSSISDQRAQLEKQLADIESQIAQYQKDLAKVGSQKNTLANKIKQYQIKQAQIILQIKDTNLRLSDLQLQLMQSQAAIDENERDIVSTRNNLAAVLKQLWKSQTFTFLDFIASSDNFSDFCNREHTYTMINSGLKDMLQSLKTKEADLQQSQQDLANQKDQQVELLSIASLQNSQLEQSLNEQSTLLTQVKGQEKNYQASLKQSNAEASAIKGRIYSLIGVSAQIDFGEAVSIAKWAGDQTGVAPAMLLAILTQESSLGQNVGTCNRAGDPTSKGWKVVMSPTRDQAPFLQITRELGRDPDTTPVSCPMHDKTGKQIGWGGAMGPAQFIPSTWLGYENKITAITGKIANPWDIRDAFLAAALKLGADGATTPSGEWAAAMKYFCGSTNPAYSFYGDNVMATAAKYQADIDKLSD